MMQCRFSHAVQLIICQMYSKNTIAPSRCYATTRVHQVPECPHALTASKVSECNKKVKVDFKCNTN